MSIILAQACWIPASAESLSWIDSLATRYSVAAKSYNAVVLQRSAESIARQPLEERQKPQALLLLGLIYWRLELIAYCTDVTAEMNRYGKLALEKLTEAENAGADIYLTASHKALASQLLAGQSLSKGAIYGPRAAAELKKAQRVNPNGYFSLLIDALNVNQAPSFAGGNPEKAVLLLNALAIRFPDSIDVKIHLADAFIKTGRTRDAAALITPVTKAFPWNLLARKIAVRLPGGKIQPE